MSEEEISLKQETSIKIENTLARDLSYGLIYRYENEILFFRIQLIDYSLQMGQIVRL